MTLRILHYADVENAYDDASGIGRLAGLIKELRDEETIICGSGDNTGPGVLSVVTKGRQALDFFEAVDPDAETFGNHDFDHGPEHLLKLVDESPQPWVCANAFRNGDRFAGTQGAVPWTIIEAGNTRVGIIGVAHPETVGINPYAGDVEFTDPVPAVEEGISTLSGRGVDRLIVLSHLGDDTDLARAVDADVILGGHDHDRLVDCVAGTLVCRPGGNGRFVLEVSFEGEAPTATHHSVADGPPDTEVATALRNRAEAAGLMDVVGTAETPVVCDMMASKRGESRLGNLVTDAFRTTADADIAVFAAGGFRRRPPFEGTVTAFDLVGVMPFDRELVSLRVDGETLCDVFRQLALAHFDDAPHWFFGHVSGASIVWDDVANELRSAHVNGGPIESTKQYDIATTEFLVENDTLFPAFRPDDVVEAYGLVYEVLVEYVRTVGLNPRLEGRIQRPTLDPETVPDRDWPFSPE
ncbi:bifunctional metallophosphatase/5'-nucleotidase [Halomarina salina]|uniref:Bifunctional metallophosphatase/5'-nucleotidase n=1 Tax=Halomarina salina TaxID=1872699 RepID=A0ABD5RU49_9EURY|nr:bifunctional metallophosphatase/5'-nucleotidase [Halomarina salina]